MLRQGTDSHGREPIHDELVRFDNVKGCYNLEAAHPTLTYSLDATAETTLQDWIGLFPIQWQDTKQPLAFTLAAPRSKSKKKKKRPKTEDKRQLDFPLGNIDKCKEPSQQYQFVYVAKHGAVYGISKPFTIQGEELWNLEGDDDDFSRLSSLQSSPVSAQHDSEISIISRGNLGSTDSPVILSYPSDGEVEWEIPNLPDTKVEKDESPLSEFSDIEILSTSPSKDDAGKYTNVVAFTEDDFILSEVKISSPTQEKASKVSDDVIESIGQDSGNSKQSRKRSKRNRNKKEQQTTENMVEQIVHENVITESLVEKLKFIDTGGESSNAENELSDEEDKRQEIKTKDKKGKKKRKKDKSKQLLITELSPAQSTTSIYDVVDTVTAEREASTSIQTHDIHTDVNVVGKKNKTKHKKKHDSVEDTATPPNVCQTEETVSDVSSTKTVKSKEKVTVTQNVKDASSSSLSPPMEVRNQRGKESKKRKKDTNNASLINDEPIERHEDTQKIKTACLTKTTETQKAIIELLKFDELESKIVETTSEQTKHSKSKKRDKKTKQTNAEVEELNKQENPEDSNKVQGLSKVEEKEEIENNAQTQIKDETKSSKKSKKNARGKQTNDSEDNPNEIQEPVVEKTDKTKKDLINMNIKQSKTKDDVTKGTQLKKGSTSMPETINNKTEATLDERSTISKTVRVSDEEDKNLEKKKTERVSKSSSKIDKKSKKEKKWKDFNTLQNEIKTKNADIQQTKPTPQSTTPPSSSKVPVILKKDYKQQTDVVEVKTKNGATTSCPDGLKHEQKSINTLFQGVFSGTGKAVVSNNKQISTTMPTTISKVEEEPDKISKKKSKKERKLEKKRNSDSTSTTTNTSDSTPSVKTYELTPVGEVVETRASSQIFSGEGLSQVTATADHGITTCKESKNDETKEIKEEQINLGRMACAVYEKEIRMKEYRRKYLSKAKGVKSAKMKAVLKLVAKRDRRASASVNKAGMLKKVLGLSNSFLDKDTAVIREDDDEEEEEEEEENKTQTNNEQRTQESSQSATSSPPNDVTNFPPLKERSKENKEKTMPNDDRKPITALLNDSNTPLEHSTKFTLKLGLKLAHSDASAARLRHQTSSDFLSKLCGQGSSTSNDVGGGSGNGSLALNRSHLLDVMDAVPKDPSAFNFVQWRKEQAYGKNIAKHKVPASMKGAEAVNTFKVAEKVANLKQATKRPHSELSPSFSFVCAEKAARKESPSGLLASYATVLKRKDTVETLNEKENENILQNTSTKQEKQSKSHLQFSSKASSKSQGSEARMLAKARRAIFTGNQTLNMGQAAIEAQCYLLDKAEDKGTKTSRTKHKTARSLRLIKEKHKKSRQLRIQNRRLKELRNAGMLSYSFVPKPVSSQQIPVFETPAKDEIIQWPLPETPIECTSSKIAPKVLETSSQDQKNNAVVVFGNIRTIQEFGTSADEALSCRSGGFIEELDVGVEEDEEERMRIRWPELMSVQACDEDNGLLRQLEKSVCEFKKQYEGFNAGCGIGKTDVDFDTGESFKKKRSRNRDELPKSLKQSHQVIQSLRLAVKTKEQEVTSLQNDVNELKDAIKKQTRQELKARFKLIAIKKKYHAFKASRGSSTASKRSREGDDTNGVISEEEEDDWFEKEPPCKRKRFEVPTRLPQEAQVTKEINPGCTSQPRKKDKNRESNLYPNIQEELKNLQREVNEYSKQDTSQTSYCGKESGIEAGQSLQSGIFTFESPNNFVRCAPSPSTDVTDQKAFTDCRGCTNLPHQYQKSFNNGIEQHQQQQQHFQSENGFAQRTNAVSNYSLPGDETNKARHASYHTPGYGNVTWGRRINDQLCYSPPRPALLPTPPRSVSSPPIEARPVIPMIHRPQAPIGHPVTFTNEAIPDQRPPCPSNYHSNSPTWNEQYFQQQPHGYQQGYRTSSMPRQPTPTIPRSTSRPKTKGHPSFVPNDSFRRLQVGEAYHQQQRQSPIYNQPRQYDNNGGLFHPYPSNQFVWVYEEAPINAPLPYPQHPYEVNCFYNEPCHCQYNNYRTS